MASNGAPGPVQAAAFQEESPQDGRQGSTWGPDAASTASSGSRARPGRQRVIKDQIDENYEDGLRMLNPLRCCLASNLAWYHIERKGACLPFIESIQDIQQAKGSTDSSH